MTDLIGKTILHYNITEKLGEGGMGVVYRAKDTKLNRFVALKFLPAHLVRRETEKARFLQEAKAAAALNHPNVCTIYEIQNTGDQPFIAMEYVEGKNLREIIYENSSISKKHVIEYAIAIAKALQEAHQAGIIHRDIKSENIMVNAKNQVKVMDFGLAKVQGSNLVTKTEHIAGTMAYMSPEQARGEVVDQRTDIWSFGVVLYEMLAVKLPFKGEYEQAFIYSILNEPSEPLKTQTELQQVIDRCLEKDRENRYSDMDEIISALKDRKDKKSISFEHKTIALKPSFLEQEKKESKHEKFVFVGRKNELSKMDEHLTTALSGQVQTIFLTGEAGSGKTALVAEFSQHAQAKHLELIVLTGKCRDRIGILDPLLPFREILDQLTGDLETAYAAGEITREQAIRLWILLPISITALIDVGGILIGKFISGTSLLKRAETAMQGDTRRLTSLQKLVAERKTAPMQPPLNKNEILRQYTEVLRMIAKRHPLLLILEDLHWADTDSIHLLFHLIKSLAGCKVLVVGTFRSSEIAQGRKQDRHPLASIINELKQQGKELEIEVGKTDKREFIDALLDKEPNRLDQTFRDTLFRQTRGNPFFTIQLLRDMQEQGILLKDEKGIWHEGRSFYWEHMPARIDAVIGERIDRLPENLRKVLNAACVEGEDFSAEIIAKILKLDEREIVHILSSELDKKHHLISALHIKRVNGQRLSQYRFRHILFQKYLYGRLDNIEKSYLHEDVGIALEEVYETKSNQIAAQLARHFEEAEINQKSIHYFLQAGNNVMKLSANDQAIKYFKRGLSLLEKLPETEDLIQLELDLQLGYGIALQPLKGFSSDEVEQVYNRAYELIKQMKKPAEFFKILWGFWVVRLTRAEFKDSLKFAKQLIEIAQKEQDSELMLQALHASWTSDFYRGEFSQAQGYCQKGLELYDPAKHMECTYEYGNHDPGICANGLLSFNLLLQGYAEQAIRQLQNVISLSKKIEHSFSISNAFQTVAMFRYYQRDLNKALIAAKELIVYCEKHNHIIWMAIGNCVYGWSLIFKKEDPEEGLTQLHKGIEILKKAEANILLPWCAVLLAEASIEIGDFDLAEKALNDSLQKIRDFGSHFCEAEHYRLKGKLAFINTMAKKGNKKRTFQIETEQNYQKAIEISKKQKAKLLELRATTDLSKLWQLMGNKTEALTMLQQVYNWFDEGFDLLDLQEAKELLTELRQ